MPATMFTPRQCVCARVCVCVCVGGPSGLLLAQRLKQCQQVCDETSQTIPHLSLSLSLFSILALLVSLSPRLSNPLFSHLSLSLVHYFFSLSICLTDNSLLVVSATCLLIPLPPVSIHTSIKAQCLFSLSLALTLSLCLPLSPLRTPSLSLFATYQRSIDHIGPRVPDLVVSCIVRSVSFVPECTSVKATKTEQSSKESCLYKRNLPDDRD